ncbi:MAG: GNAT family N-acetyltransferase [Clostridia bacterium]|nr:GNAT family N-acetyltransferase [Clostridia bacterium]
MFPHSIETQRLLLRPMSLDDAEACFVWCSDPVVNQFMTYPLYTCVDEVRQWLTRMQVDGQILLWGIERQFDGLLIGSASLSWKPEEKAMNLGYNLRSDCWGQGYATEAARAIIEAGRQLGYHDFIACHAVENVGSSKVIQRCDFLFDRHGEYAKYDGSITFPARFYTLHLD